MPLRPSSTTSGTAPRPMAATGVPQAIDSTITSPKGSGHWMGNSVTIARWSSVTFSSWETSPRYSMLPSRCGSHGRVEVLAFLHVVDLAGELERQARSPRAISTALCAPLSGDMRPTNSRYPS